MKLAQDRVQWRALILAVLNLRVLLPESWSADLHTYTSRSVKLLLALASTTVPGFKFRRHPGSRFLFSPRHVRV
jgi:hypothetical protein